MAFDPTAYGARPINAPPAPVNGGFDPVALGARPISGDTSSNIPLNSNTAPTANVQQSSSTNLGLAASLAAAPLGIPTPTLNNYASSEGKALIGGLSTGMSYVPEAIVDGAAWVLHKIGAISPGTKKMMEKSVADDLKIFRADSNPNGDMFDKATAEHPYIAKAGQLGAEIPAMLSTPTVGAFSAPAGAGMLAKAGGFVGNQLGNIAINAPLAAGASGTDTRDQDSAAMLAGVLTPAASLASHILGSSANSIVNKKELPQTILQKYMAPINASIRADGSMSITDQAANSVTSMYKQASKTNEDLWQDIKNIPGNIDTSNLKDQAKFLLKQANITQTANGWDTASSLLEKPQASTLVNAFHQINNIQNVNDALGLKQMLSEGFSKIKGGQTSPNVYSSYLNLMKTLDSNIGQTAADNGLANDYSLAKNFWNKVMIPLNNMDAGSIAKVTANKTTDTGAFNDVMKNFMNIKNPDDMVSKMQMMANTDGTGNGSQIMQNMVINNLFKDIAHSPDSINPNQALLNLNRMKYTYGPVMSKDSNAVLDGLKETLEAGGATTSKSGKSLQTAAETLAGAALGFHVGGPIGAAAGAFGGSKVSSSFLQGLNALLDVPGGMSILKGIGKGKAWADPLSKVLGIGMPAELANKYTSIRGVQ